MFTFRCAGCGKQHVVNEPFAEDYSTRCLRCGKSIHVTPEIAHPVGAGVPSPGQSGHWDEAITATEPEGATAGSGVELADQTEEELADHAEGADDADGGRSGPRGSGARAESAENEKGGESLRKTGTRKATTLAMPATTSRSENRDHARRPTASGAAACC